MRPIKIETKTIVSVEYSMQIEKGKKRFKYRNRFYRFKYPSISYSFNGR